MQFDPEALSDVDAYKLMISCIVPRPIAWVTTVSPAGITNAAPFSFFNGLDSKPALITLGIGWRGDGSPKDSLRNIQDTGEFVINVVTEPAARIMVQSSKSYPPDVSEIDALGLETLPSALVKPPRLALSPVHMECSLVKPVELDGAELTLIIGRVLRYHVEDRLWKDGQVDPELLQPVGRLGGRNYLRGGTVFSMTPE